MLSDWKKVRRKLLFQRVATQNETEATKNSATLQNETKTYDWVRYGNAGHQRNILPDWKDLSQKNVTIN